MHTYLHPLLLIAHFAAMILGLGQVIAVAVLTAASISDRQLLSRLVSFVSWGIPIVFVTGIGLVALAPDHPEHHWWLRGVTLLTIYLGYLSGTSKRVLRTASDPVERDRLSVLRRKAWTMAATTAVIIVLISVKPL